MSSSSPCERDVRQQHIPYRQRQPLGTTGPPGCGYDPTYASSGAGINQAIGYCCGNSADLMHEVVLGSNVEIPVPIHTANNYLIANSTGGRLFHGVTPSVAGGQGGFGEFDAHASAGSSNEPDLLVSHGIIDAQPNLHHLIEAQSTLAYIRTNAGPIFPDYVQEQFERSLQPSPRRLPLQYVISGQANEFDLLERRPSFRNRAARSGTSRVIRRWPAGWLFG